MFYDEALSCCFQKKHKTFNKRIIVWKKREGMERYIYANFLSMIKLGVNSGKDYVLFPENIDSLKIVQRNYYNRYLEKSIDIPEVDGKQIILFQKMTPKNALSILEDLGNNDHFNLFEDKNEFYLLKNILEDKINLKK